MYLTPTESNRLLIFSAAELARRRRSRGLKLNYPEAVALITDEVMEAARAGASYEDAVRRGGEVLTRADVMEGVPEMAAEIRLEVLLEEGSKLIVLRDPIR